jgi:hypothetical protein
MGRLFSDGAFAERLKKKYEILAGRKQEHTGAVDQDVEKFLSDEAHWADIRKRNTALELQDKINAGAFGLQNLKNTGSLETQKAENVGIIARQKLDSDLGLEGTKYTADQHLTGVKYHSDMLGESARNTGVTELIKAHSGVLNNTLSTPEQRKESEEALRSLTTRATGRSTSEFDIPDAPQVEQPISPIRAGLDKKGGAEAMTFNTSMGTAENQAKKRKELLDSFYRMNPGIKPVLK